MYTEILNLSGFIRSLDICISHEYALRKIKRLLRNSLLNAELVFSQFYALKTFLQLTLFFLRLS